MSHARTFVIGVLAMTAFALICVPLPAADPRPSVWTPPEASADVAEPGWGTAATNVLTLHTLGFVTIEPTAFTITTDATGTYRYVDPIDNFGALYHGLELPTGAEVTSVAIDGCDEDAALGLGFFIRQDPRGPSPNSELLINGTTAGTPGCQSFPFDANPPFTIDNADNSYYVVLVFNGSGIELRAKAVRVYYQLQVSPAPASATFADVPTDYWAFRYIEALAASGITAGCGGDSFCPDAPLSRAQMAVFLAKALGLHWE
jgi:hypothetical protein